MKKVIIYGFGRMGLTHYAILNQLIENADFVFVDPDYKVNYFAKRNLKARILSNDKTLNETFDYALVCTPPMFHIPILEKCIDRGITNIFVEKPFGGVNDNFSIAVTESQHVSVGYVLRFNPIVNWVKQFIDLENILKVEGFYFSNTIEKKPVGWRNGLYSGVTNEVGAHIIDLCVFLFGLTTPTLVNRQINSIISDVDDILIADLEENSIKYHLHFDWVNKAFRKPVFKFVVTMRDGSIIKFDQQKCEYFNDGKLMNRVTSVDLSQNVPFYLRGVDFTCQIQDFIGLKETIATVSEAMITRNLIKTLLAK
jgi:predicted dehydrogenase